MRPGRHWVLKRALLPRRASLENQHQKQRRGTVDGNNSMTVDDLPELDGQTRKPDPEKPGNKLGVANDAYFQPGPFNSESSACSLDRVGGGLWPSMPTVSFFACLLTRLLASSPPFAPAHDRQEPAVAAVHGEDHHNRRSRAAVQYVRKERSSL